MTEVLQFGLCLLFGVSHFNKEALNSLCPNVLLTGLMTER